PLVAGELQLARSGVALGGSHYTVTRRHNQSLHLDALRPALRFGLRARVNSALYRACGEREIVKADFLIIDDPVLHPQQTALIRKVDSGERVRLSIPQGFAKCCNT